MFFILIKLIFIEGLFGTKNEGTKKAVMWYVSAKLRKEKYKENIETAVCKMRIVGQNKLDLDGSHNWKKKRRTYAITWCIFYLPSY